MKERASIFIRGCAYVLDDVCAVPIMLVMYSVFHININVPASVFASLILRIGSVLLIGNTPGKMFFKITVDGPLWTKMAQSIFVSCFIKLSPLGVYPAAILIGYFYEEMFYDSFLCAPVVCVK